MAGPIDVSRPFSWNPGHTASVGTEIVGNLSIGIPNAGFNSPGFNGGMVQMKVEVIL